MKSEKITKSDVYDKIDVEVEMTFMFILVL